MPVGDDGVVLVKVEQVSARSSPATVRVCSDIGTVVVCWRGTPEAVGREPRVEWTVDEDIVRAGNTWLGTAGAPKARPGIPPELKDTDQGKAEVFRPVEG